MRTSRGRSRRCRSRAVLAHLLDPRFALGGEGVEFFVAATTSACASALFDETCLDLGGELLRARSAGMALGDLAQRAHEQGLQFEGLGGLGEGHGR